MQDVQRINPRGGFKIPFMCQLTLQKWTDFPINSESGEGYFKKSIEFINNLDHDINIGDRTGMKMTLRRRPLPLKDTAGRQMPAGLYILVVYNYNPEMCIFKLPDPVMLNNNMKLNQEWNSDAPRTEAIQTHQLLGKNLSRRTFIYVVEPKDLKHCPTYYFSDIDYVVSLENNNIWSHPYSSDGYYTRGLAENKMESVISPHIFSFNIEIVAEEGKVSNKYVNIGNKIYQVRVNHQILREPGVYVYYNKRVNEDGIAGMDNQDYFPLSELEKGVYGNKEKSSLPILLFNTAEDAMIYGDLDRARDIELKQLKRQLDDQKMLMDQQKLRMEELKLQADEQSHRQKMEFEQMKNERDRIERELDFQERLKKHANESNKLERQEQLEIIKYIPAVLGVAMTILAFYTKISNSK